MEKYNGTVQAENGDIITTASIEVFLANTGTPASLFEDDETTPLNNPFTSNDSNYDAKGMYFFKAANGAYDIKLTNGGDVTWVSDVSLFDSDDAGFTQNKVDATVDPTVTDDSNAGYSVNSKWINITTDIAYICIDASVGAAIWKIITPTITSITDNGNANAMTIDSSEDIQYIGTAQYAAGEGIVFNGDAIAAANTLDDYEEGIWTPTLSGSVVSGDHTYTTQAGTYEKIGRQVNFRCRLILTTKGTISGNITLKGLPFTSSNDSDSYGSVWVGHGSSLLITSSESLSGIINVATTNVSLKIWSATTGTANFSDSELTDTSQFILAGQYYV